MNKKYCRPAIVFTHVSAFRRKQRKPQNVRKVVKDGDDEVYEAVKLETDTGLELSGSETVNSDKKPGENDEDPPPLFGE